MLALAPLFSAAEAWAAAVVLLAEVACNRGHAAAFDGLATCHTHGRATSRLRRPWHLARGAAPCSAPPCRLS